MILNSIHSAIDSIHAEEALKLKTKNAVYARASGRRSVFMRTAAAAAAACIAAIVCFTGGYMYFTPVYAVSIDNGYSTELGVNRFDRVVSVSSSGEDSAEPDVMHMNYTDALSAVLENSGGADVAVTVAGDSEEKTSEMITAVEGCNHSGQLHCYGTDSQTAAEAQENGMPLGKYRAYLELKQYEPEITPEDVENMTAREIRDKVSEYTGSAPQSGNGGSGNCTGTGSGAGNGTGTGNGSGAGAGSGQHHGRSGQGHGKHKTAEP